MKIIPDYKNISTLDFTEKDKDLERKEDSIKSKNELEKRVVLSKNEINELINYEFYIGPKNIEEQVHKYYLLIKKDYPIQAYKLLQDLENIEIKSEHDVIGLCFTLNKYISGFIIEDENKVYSINGTNVKIISIEKEAS